MKIKYLLILIVCIFISSCEDIDDTFSEISKKEKIRYVGKCKNLKIDKGWKRFKLSWENSLDPCIEKIKIKWKHDTQADSIELPPETTEYTTDFEVDYKTYEFILSAVDEKGNESIPLNKFIKPFTEEDTKISMLKIIDKKCFKFDNTIIIFLFNYASDIEEAKINYKNAEGNQIKNITKEDFEIGYIELSDVSDTDDITVKTSLKINECFDIIDFEPYVLDGENSSLSPEFDNILKEKLNIETVDKSIFETITALDISRDITSLEDILCFPNLKKLTLGGEKYLDVMAMNPQRCLLTLQNKESSIFALNLLHKMNPDFELEIYGNHFEIADNIDFEISKNYPNLPIITFYDNMEDWIITSNYEKDIMCNDFKNLLDKNTETFWKPIESSTSLRKHEVQIDMKEEKYIDRILISQIKYSYFKDYLPEAFEIMYSKDGDEWKYILKNPMTKLGVNLGESTIIKIPEGINARYIRFLVQDRSSNNHNNYVVLGDFIPYKSSN